MRLAPVFEDYINIKKEVCGMSSCGHQVEGKHSAEKRKVAQQRISRLWLFKYLSLEY